MKVAVIGTGAMGSRHARLLGELAEVEEVLVVDALPERAEAVAREIGGQPAVHDEALARDDGIVVCTPAVFHRSSVEPAIARGVPVLCEKPLTDDLANSQALVAMAEAVDAHVEIGFQRRHDPAYTQARERIVDGSAGRLHLLRLTAFDPVTNPRLPSEWPPDGPAPLFLHSWIHDFDFVRWISGQEVTEVSADGSRNDGSRPDDPGRLETAVITMRLSGGALAVLEASWLHPTGYDSRVELLADHAHLSMGWTGRTPVTALDPLRAEPEPTWTGYLDRFDAAYRAELMAFLAAARGERPPTSTARDGLEALRVAIAATRSFVERRVVDLDEIPGLPGPASGRAGVAVERD
jgi:myo-inositol 2-dehydrogenase / D-chiro-inositol 1-dehydrogenase